jgi:hypothetical protein
MARVFKCDLFYGLGKQGWTETYYVSDDTYDLAAAKANLINTARLELSLAEVTCSGIRVSDVDIKGDAANFVATTKTGQHAPVVDPPGTWAPDDAVLFRFYSLDNARRTRHFVAGVPVGDVDPGGPPQFSPDDNGVSATAYITAVKTNAVMWITRTVHPAVAIAIDHGSFRVDMHTRKRGRPFGQPVGRRRTA